MSASESVVPDSPTGGNAGVSDGVLITAELDRRPSRVADYKAESDALGTLATAMASAPKSVLQRLVEMALELCKAGSAGISIWDQSAPDVFRWIATAGEYSPYIGGTLPRHFSPCGLVLEQNRILLMADPVRLFPYIADLSTPAREVLLVPFYQGDAAVGTVWIVAHTPDRHFDAEDARIVTSLSRFAGAAVQVLGRIDAAESTERSLRQSEERFRALVTATSDVVYRMNADWTEMRQLVGREFLPDITEPNSSWLDRFIPKSDHLLVTKTVAEALRNKQKFELEHRVLRLDGTTGWTFSRAIPVLDEAGNVSEWFGAASDVSERKSTEGELQDIRSRMEAALEAGAIGTWAWDVPNDRFYADASLAKIFALPPEGVRGAPIADLMRSIHPADVDRVSALVTCALEFGSRYEADYRVTDGNGGWRWVSARGIVQQDSDGRAVRFPGVVIDVTERKRAEEELLQLRADSERRTRLYEAVLSSTPDFAYVWGLDHRFMYANEGLLKVWGRSWDEAIGKNCLELGYEPWHAAMHDREIEEVRRTKQPLRGEVPFVGTAGRRIYDYLLVPVIGADGEVEAVAGTTRDVTERQAMEQELREQDRKKDDFIALLAHELRNPLAPIRNGLQVLRLAAGDADALLKAREIMERQLAHMVRLIDDLLDVSRINRNKMELRETRLSLSEVVASSVETARPILDSAGHNLSVKLPDNPVSLNGDLTRLSQVFSNLLTNSAKYTPPGGKVWLTATIRDKNVEISVRDSGIGIPAEALPKIFDMFSQVNRPVERNTGGLGIGLALVKVLVEMHGGTVAAASDGPNLGSTFTVTLPVTADTDGTRQPEHEHLHGSTGQRVLVVDDNRDGADSMASMLRLLGNEVETAHDGLEAFIVAEKHRPDLILMDIGMPRRNGLDATRQIREAPWGRDILVIALTGWGQDTDRDRTKEAGCDGHLVKPVTLNDLERVLAESRASKAQLQ